MTWRQIIDNAVTELISAGISDPNANAEWIAVHILKLNNRSDLRLSIPKTVDDNSILQFTSLIERRKQREPLQYILGEWEFFGLPIFVGPEALIPRPETEILVTEALTEADRLNKPEESLRILDLGTGTGAIALAIASRLPNASSIGIDKSLPAIQLARKNLDRLGFPNVRFEQLDIMDDTWLSTFTHSVDLLVSNPPYVSIEDFTTLEPELRHEPRLALTDESTGLTFYHRIAAIAPTLLTEEGKLIVELGYGQAQAVLDIMQAAGFEVLRIVNDLSGILRILVARKLLSL
jgi:release factor glutamine methyltransferase